MKKTFVTNSKKETWQLVPEILGRLENRNVILLKGELGGGKTTFSQGILNYLGARGPFTSPTFVIIKKYGIENEKYNNVFHLDCYRVGAKSVLELGWEEIVDDKNNLVLVEWPEKIKSILPERYLQLDFEILKGDKRRIKLK